MPKRSLHLPEFVEFMFSAQMCSTFKRKRPKRQGGILSEVFATPAEADCMAALMAQYQDTPMDLANASLVVVAESRTLRCVFTTDSDFYVYRLVDGSALEVVP